VETPLLVLFVAGLCKFLRIWSELESTPSVIGEARRETGAALSQHQCAYYVHSRRSNNRGWWCLARSAAGARSLSRGSHLYGRIGTSIENLVRERQLSARGLTQTTKQSKPEKTLRSRCRRECAAW
jgi:hypothetical protein